MNESRRLSCTQCGHPHLINEILHSTGQCLEHLRADRAELMTKLAAKEGELDTLRNRIAQAVGAMLQDEPHEPWAQVCERVLTAIRTA